MANLSEPSSSFSFTSSCHLSNGSITHNLPSSPVSEATPAALDVISLTKLSFNLESLLADSSTGGDYTDAEVVVDGKPVGIHRCILAARSKFFDELFKRDKGSSEKGRKPRYSMNDDMVLPYGKIGYEALMILLSYLYTGKLKPFPMEVSTCVHPNCAHDACRPTIDFAVELMYGSSIFQLLELVSLFQRRLHNFVDKALVEDIIPVLMAAFHCQSTQLVSQCVDRVARSNIDDVCIEKELPYEVAEKVKLVRRKPVSDDEESIEVVDPIREKRIKRIHKALDSDDVELVKLLLTESDVTLDDAYGLHYAAAYCDPKVVQEVLNLRQADVNRRDSRGYTVLHIAAMRRKPSVLVSLLEKGACASDATRDGQTAVSICRRLTTPKDYHSKTEQGQEANKAKICIEVLQREMRRNPVVDYITATPHTPDEDLHMKLLYLENREPHALCLVHFTVAFARLFFPTEAKLAMDIANADTTPEFSGLAASRASSGNLREVDLNETPTMQKRRILTRLVALKKTVETGRRFFPNCSEVLDKFMEDDLPDVFYLEKGSADEQRIKRNRYLELKDDVQKAFTKDKAENRNVLSSSSTLAPVKNGSNKRLRKS
ncbi:BTB/POZ domain and ankyrin repeat-containing protein NPR1 [Linum perenne]